MTSGAEDGTTPVGHALDRLAASLDQLLAVVEGGGLERCDSPGSVGFLEGVERVRNRLPLVDHVVIGEGERRGLAEALCQGSMRQVLIAGLRLSPGEAARRVRAAAAVGPRASMTGEPLPPARPVLAAAQRTGAVTPSVDLIVRGLGSVDRRGFDPADIAAGERLLTGFAARFGPRDLKNLTDKTVEAIDPDGTLPAEEVNRDRRFFRLRPTRDGGYAGEFRLTGCCAPAGCPTRAAPRPPVIVTLTLDDLLDRLGYATTSDGTLLSAREVVTLAGQADIVPAVLSRTGAVLDLGRTRRIATPNQTYASPPATPAAPSPAAPPHPSGALAPHRGLGRRRRHQPGQPHPAVQLPPPQLRRPRLDLPAQPRRTPGPDPTPLDRPPAGPDDQQPDRGTPPRSVAPPHSHDANPGLDHCSWLVPRAA